MSDLNDGMGFNRGLVSGDTITIAVKENDVSLKIFDPSFGALMGSPSSSNPMATVEVKMDQQELYEIGFSALCLVQGSVDEDVVLDLIETVVETPEQVERTKLLLRNILLQLGEDHDHDGSGKISSKQ